MAAVATLAGCSEDAPPRSELACTLDPGGAPLTTEAVLEGGPYAIGQTSFELVDDTRSTPANGDVPAVDSRTLQTAVWYPAASEVDDAPVASGGPFPLVVYSHGYSSFNTEGAELNKLLASYGYVVFAPMFPLTHLGTEGGPNALDVVSQPGDVSFVIDSALAMSETASHLFEGAIDAERIAAVGLSLGGLTTLLVTFHPTLRDPRIDVAAAMAPPASFFGDAFYDFRDTPAPLLLLSGDIDAIVPHSINAVLAYERANSPVSLLTLVNGTHTGFTVAALAFASLPNVDSIGCAAVGGGGGDADAGPPPPSFADALGGAEAGIVPAMDLPECVEPLPPGMHPRRQLDVESAAVWSFLEAYLASDAAARGRACHFHERVLPAGADDLRFETR